MDQKTRDAEDAAAMREIFAESPTHAEQPGPGWETTEYTRQDEGHTIVIKRRGGADARWSWSVTAEPRYKLDLTPGYSKGLADTREEAELLANGNLGMMVALAAGKDPT